MSNEEKLTQYVAKNFEEVDISFKAALGGKCQAILTEDHHTIVGIGPDRESAAEELLRCLKEGEEMRAEAKKEAEAKEAKTAKPGKK